MPSSKKPYKPKRHQFQSPTAMYPSLHQDIMNALSDEFISPEPWFNPTGSDDDAIDQYDTNIMGRFHCRNPACPKQGWGSKKIAILIRQYPDNGYNAVVFKQRCKSCQQLGALRLDENSYVERVVYRLKKWAGIYVERPDYDGKLGPPHERALCEGCKRGHCQGS
jgi:hypothetical protein